MSMVRITKEMVSMVDLLVLASLDQPIQGRLTEGSVQLTSLY
jgi:hypothetical protein